MKISVQPQSAVMFYGETHAVVEVSQIFTPSHITSKSWMPCFLSSNGPFPGPALDLCNLAQALALVMLSPQLILGTVPAFL